MVDVDEGETSVGRITVLTLKRHLHLGDPRSGRWISRADETPVHRRLCNSNRPIPRRGRGLTNVGGKKSAAIRDRETDKTMGCLEGRQALTDARDTARGSEQRKETT